MRKRKSFYEEIKEITDKQSKRYNNDKFINIEIKKLKKTIKKRANKGFHQLLVNEQEYPIVILFCEENIGFKCDLTAPKLITIEW